MFSIENVECDTYRSSKRVCKSTKEFEFITIYKRGGNSLKCILINVCYLKHNEVHININRLFADLFRKNLGPLKDFSHIFVYL